MSEWVALVNPCAGSRPMPPERVAEALARHRVAGRVEVVDGAERMRAAVVEVARSSARPAVVGGDGTVGLAADALLSAGLASLPPLGVLPAGTGCDLLRTFGISQEVEEAAAHLATGSEYRIDVGVARGEWGVRRFVNVAQAGLGAAAAQTAARLPRRLGTARYPLALLQRLPGFPRTRVTVQGRRGLEGEALAVVLANGQFFAGGWNVAPRAMLVDGELDVQLFGARKRQVAAFLPKLVTGLHLADPSVRRRSLAEAEVVTEHPWPVEVDGDHLGSTPLHASVLPLALPLKI